jgi:hypothetical protein
MTVNSIEVAGTLQPDGNLILDEKPAMAAGRVCVALRRLAGGERLPDAPFFDDAIPAPFDLPRAGPVIRVRPRIVLERLPELPSPIAEETQ